jgi:hypothetical protein
MAAPCTHCWHGGEYGSPHVCCNCHISSTTGRASALADVTPRTQKAKGMKAIAAKATQAGLKVPDPILLLQKDADLIDCEVLFLHPPQGGWFARPCPMRPRPGFVESRSVSSAAELRTTWKETRVEDPRGEVLLMPRIDAAFNLCATPGMLAIGPGHDGATAGKASLALPLTGQLPKELQAIADVSGLGDGEACHLEAVIGKSLGAGSMYGSSSASVYLVQARAGVPHPGGRDYIPTMTYVKQVVVPCDDLLEWETKAKALDGAEGVVVWGKGHTLGSHAALHCLAHSIPFVTSFEPTVGAILAPSGAEAPDGNAFVEGVGWGLHCNLNAGSLRQHSMMILYGLHFAPVLTGQNAFWIGAASAAMLRIGLACGNGECAQQAPGSPCGAVGYQPAGLIHNASSLKEMLAFMPKMEAGFFLNGLDGNWVPQMSGIGGWNWGRCIYSLFALNNAMHDAVVAWQGNDTAAFQAAVKRVIGSLNKAVDQAHNGAWWLNRYGVQPQDFAHATAGGWQCAFEAAPLLYAVEQQRGSHQWQEHALAYAKWDVPVPDPFACKATINPAGQLQVAFTRRLNGALTASPSVRCTPGEGVEVRRSMQGTKQVLDFTVDRDGEAVSVYRFAVELEQDARTLNHHQKAA